MHCDGDGQIIMIDIQLKRNNMEKSKRTDMRKRGEGERERRGHLCSLIFLYIDGFHLCTEKGKKTEIHRCPRPSMFSVL